MDEVELSGSVLIPVCCFPFCSIAGWHHVFEDDDMEKFFKVLPLSPMEEVELRKIHRIQYNDFLKAHMAKNNPHKKVPEASGRGMIEYIRTFLEEVKSEYGRSFCVLLVA